ncbi:MAG: hypothetical protein K2Q45_05315 [Nitrosomonas sp.]|nr:hypothetical protein [Nitrosomonas sp.]
MNGWWAKLHVPIYNSNPNVARLMRNALRNWFQTHPQTETDYVTVDFDAHVKCFYIEHHNDEHVVNVDLASLSPITDAFVLFYSFYNPEKQLFLWGGLPFTTIEKMEGTLTVGFIKKHQSRAFFMKSVVELERPLSFVEMHPVQLLTHQSFNELDFSELDNRDMNIKLDWYLEVAHVQHHLDPPVFSCPTAEFACIGYALELAYGILYKVRRDIFNNVYDGRVLCNKFRQMIVTAELGFLYNRLILNYHKEEDLMRLLTDINGLQFATPTCLDEQVFCRMYPNANVLMPRYWISIPMEEYTAAAAESMPLHKGGRVHLPVYWEAVYDWLACRFRSAVQKHFYVERNNCVRRLLERESKDMTRIIKFIMTDKPVPVPVSFSNDHHGPAAEIDKTHGIFVSDIEDIWSTMPPCMRNLYGKGRFPRNGERLYLIPAMWQGGFSMAAIEKFLSALNDKWPKSPAETIAKRANPAALIRANRGVHWCSNVIKHTLANRDDALHCPFVSSDSFTADSCGSKCAESMNLKYPVKAPYKVIEYNVKRMTAQKPPQPQPPQAAAAAQVDDDSSSSASFDEELQDRKRRKREKIEIEMEKEMEK